MGRVIWAELATENLRAARSLQGARPRASVTRSYYAAYCAVTAELFLRGIVAFGRFNNPPHHNVGSFVLRNVGLRTSDATPIAALIASLRVLREDADYRQTALVETVDAANALRDAEIVLSAFGVPLY